jgi:hypothetical protein
MLQGIGMDAHTTAEHFTHDFWHNHAPSPQFAREIYYSTNWYTEYALSLLRNYSTADAAKLWVHLCYQAVCTRPKLALATLRVSACLKEILGLMLGVGARPV